VKIDVDSAQVTEAIAAYLKDPGIAPPEAPVIARRFAILPIYNDWIGCFALRPNGELVFVPWDEPEQMEPISDTSHDRNVVHAARAVGGRRFPSIRGLSPSRGLDARTCPGCHGTGALPNVPENFICQCGGLGWIPNLSGAA
jgi:hypothetical protein